MFKNAQIYKIAELPYAADGFADVLKSHEYAPASSLETKCIGWISPVENGSLVHSIGKQWLLKLQMESKVLPASVLNKATQERAKEVEESQGFYPGRKQLKEIKEQVFDELLPRAFSKLQSMFVWIDFDNGFIVFDTPTQSKAEEALKLLFRTMQSFPVTSLRTVRSVGAAMTDWLAQDEVSDSFTIDQDIELKSKGEGGATVRYIHHSVNAQDVHPHIDSGKQCTRLAMTWDGKISFTLQENGQIKKIKLLDVLKEDAESTAKNNLERFDANFLLFSGEFSKLLNSLIDALGGEYKEEG